MEGKNVGCDWRRWNFSTLQPIWIYFMAGRFPTKSNSIVLFLCRRFLVCVNSKPPPLLSPLFPSPRPLKLPFWRLPHRLPMKCPRSKLGLCSRQNQAAEGGELTARQLPNNSVTRTSSLGWLSPFPVQLPAIWGDNDVLSILRAKIELPVECLQYCVVRKYWNTVLFWISNNDKIFWCLFSFDAGYWPYHVVTWRSCYGECKADTGQRNTHRRC